jgi:methionine-rich copper-binding protein CopC
MKTVLRAILLILIFGIARLAWAHAFIDRAEPAVGSKLTASPGFVKIWFTETLEPAFSKIQVLDDKGIQVDRQDTRVDPNDRRLLIVSLPILAPGKYKVVWRVVSVDTHSTNGSFGFELFQ